MAKMNPYLNFNGNAAEAFEFYKSVFGGEFIGLHRIGDAPGMEGLSEEDKKRVMHVSLPVSEGYTLMGSDIIPAFGHSLTVGNNVHVSLHPASREEADKLFNGLSAGGIVEMPMADQFWGSYYGSFTDKFGIKWMINYDTQSV